MSTEIIVAVISLLGTACGTFAGIITSTKLSNYRIEQLEKKVEKHNSVVERVYVVERDLKTAWREIDEIKSDLKEQEHEHERLRGE